MTNMELRKVQLTGGSSISVTLDIYSAVLPNMQRAAVEHLAASLGGE